MTFSNFLDGGGILKKSFSHDPLLIITFSKNRAHEVVIKLARNLKGLGAKVSANLRKRIVCFSKL